MSEGKAMQTENQNKTKVSVQGVPETMLQTLFARAAESRKENHNIYDEKAIEIVSRLDYDFSKAESDKLMSSGVIARTIVLDRLVNDYLTKHPDTIVVNIACGLDTRCYRMKGKYQRWYNIDLPETMDIRSRFLEENGPIYQIAKSDLKKTKEFIDTLKTVDKVEVLPYHKLGIQEWERLGIPYKLEGIDPPTEEQQKLAKSILEK